MKTTIIVITLAVLAMVLWLVSLVTAAPYVVCDRQTAATTYVSTADGVVTTLPATNGWVQNNKVYLTDPGGTTTLVHVLNDVSGVSVGNHDYSVKACNSWGECSVAVPFAFTRPLSPTAPTGIKLSP
jgi:hypothetical protein